MIRSGTVQRFEPLNPQSAIGLLYYRVLGKRLLRIERSAISFIYFLHLCPGTARRAIGPWQKGGVGGEQEGQTEKKSGHVESGYRKSARGKTGEISVAGRKRRAL